MAVGAMLVTQVMSCKFAGRILAVTRLLCVGRGLNGQARRARVRHRRASSVKSEDRSEGEEA